MYNDGFVLSIVTNGRTNREYSKDGKSIVHLPFGAEYAVRIKSKVSTRCKADVFIDGTNISDIGSFIISPYGTMDIERFLGADMSKGHKFKFEKLSHPGVQDPNSSENGLVEVYIYREVLPTYTVTYTSGGAEWYEYPKSTKLYRTIETDHTYYLSSSVPSDSAGVSCCNSLVFEGATIEGGISNQGFVSASGFETESTPIVLRVKILGVTSNEVSAVVEYCTRCGRKRNRKDNYCGKCGGRFNK